MDIVVSVKDILVGILIIINIVTCFNINRFIKSLEFELYEFEDEDKK